MRRAAGEAAFGGGGDTSDAAAAADVDDAWKKKDRGNPLQCDFVRDEVGQSKAEPQELCCGEGINVTVRPLDGGCRRRLLLGESFSFYVFFLLSMQQQRSVGMVKRKKGGTRGKEGIFRNYQGEYS